MSFSLTQDPFSKPQADKNSLKSLEVAPSQREVPEVPELVLDRSNRLQQNDNNKTGDGLVNTNQAVDYEFVAALSNLQNPKNTNAQPAAIAALSEYSNVNTKTAPSEMTTVPLQWENLVDLDTQINFPAPNRPVSNEPERVDAGMADATQILNNIMTSPEIKANNQIDNNLTLAVSGHSLEQLQVKNIQTELRSMEGAEIIPVQYSRDVLRQAAPQEALKTTSKIALNDTKMSAPIQTPQTSAENHISAPSQTPNINTSPAQHIIPNSTPTPVVALAEDGPAVSHALPHTLPNAPKYETIKATELSVRELNLTDTRILQISGGLETMSAQNAPLVSVQNLSGLQMNIAWATPLNLTMPVLSQIGQALVQITHQTQSLTDKPGNSLNPILVQLSPAELGRVQIQFSFDGSERITANIIAENADTGVLLKQKSDMLLGFLKQSGFNNIDLNFEAKNENNFSNFGSNNSKNQNAPARELAPDNASQSPVNEEQQDIPKNLHPASTRPHMTNGQIDISI